ncbi:MAG: hypothetical protein J2P54_00475 [Bradyrhizobiaceae bacterium]|nr:hypothetical protein [Bradyrhizobiaceae bacterium]
MLTGEADIALGYNFPSSPGLRVVASHDLHLGAVVAPDHPLTKRRPAWLADCLEFPLAIADPSMTIRPIVDLAFTRAGLPLHPTIETNSIEFMSRIAAGGVPLPSSIRLISASISRAATCRMTSRAGHANGRRYHLREEQGLRRSAH